MRIINENLKCACCGEVSEQEVLLSFSTFGAPDLDLRASGMSSRAFIYSLQICPKCNYVANDISEKVSESLFACKKEYYQEAVKDCNKNGMDLDARKFFLMALVDEENGNFMSASNNYICAFWLTEISDEKIAAKLLARAVTQRKKVYNQLDERGLVQTMDLMRRNKEFDAVIRECEMLLKDEKKNFSENERKMLKYQIKICKQKDVTRHNFFDVAMDDDIR